MRSCPKSKLPPGNQRSPLQDLSLRDDFCLSSKSFVKMPRRKKEDELALSEREKIPRGAANARERTRMRVLSKAFGRLKLTLPWVPPDTKLSKLDTLRLATSYISHLQRLLSEEDGSGDDSQASDIKSHVVRAT